jgi:hypothetical protein
MYKTIILLVVSYGCETESLKTYVKIKKKGVQENIWI